MGQQVPSPVQFRDRRGELNQTVIHVCYSGWQGRDANAGLYRVQDTESAVVCRRDLNVP